MVVNYYLIQKYFEMFPLDEQYGVPKNVDELDASVLPYVTYLAGDKFGLWWTPDGQSGGIAEHMMKFNIPICIAFHIAVDVKPHIFPIKEVGGFLILHQTVHWETDTVFKLKENLGYVDHIVAPTEYARDILVRVGKVSKDNLTVIPHGVPTDKFYPHDSMLRDEWKLDGPVILYCGRLDMWKGIQQLIPCVKPLIEKYNVHFIIRGGVRQLEKSKQLDYIFTTMANRYGNHFIYIPDWQSPAFMEELMATCDIYLSPTGHEGFNVPLIEAMACEKPVVTTDLPNHREILAGTGNELSLLSPKVKVGVCDEVQDIKVPRADMIYGALTWLLENEGEAKARGMNGRKHVLENYDLENVVVKWKKLFQKLVPDKYDMSTEMAKRMLVT